MSEEQETFLEGMWDCPNCETANTGSAMRCDGCGAVRDEDVKFYLPENAKEITDDKELEAAKAGPDWVCGYCSTSNPASRQNCKQCGADRGEGENRQVKTYDDASKAPKTGEQAEHGVPENQGQEGGIGDTLKDSVGGAMAAAGSAVSQIDTDKAKSAAKSAAKTGAKVAGGAAMFMGLGCLGMMLLCCVLTMFASKPSFKSGEVSGHSWSVVSELEEYQEFSKEGWEHPSDAYAIETERKVYDHKKIQTGTKVEWKTRTEKVQTGTKTETYDVKVEGPPKKVPDGHTVTDLGNGRFKKTPKFRMEKTWVTEQRTRQVPVYRDKTTRYKENVPVYKKEPIYRKYHRYKIKRWTKLSAVTTEKQGQDNVAAPEWSLSKPPKPGDRRVTGEKWRFVLHVRDDQGQAYKKEMERGRWQAFKKGQTVVLKKSLGTLDEVLTLDEAKLRR